MIIIMFICGIVLGSFYNVVGLRIPRSGSIVFPNSHCPVCYQNLLYRDNIPMLSYILLKGKCRYCKNQISIIYPIIEALTGMLFIFAYYKMADFNLVSSLALISFIILITITDIYYYLIPNKILMFFIIIFIAIRLNTPLETWYDSFLGFFVSYLLIYLLILMSKGGIGAGDMKLLAVLGFFTGLKVALLGFVLAIMCGGLYGVYLLVIKRNKKNDALPFGPFIGFGVLISYFYHDAIISFYITELVRL